MTPETWALVIAAIFGSNGLLLVLVGILRTRTESRATVAKLRAESEKDSRIKRLEIQLQQVQAEREKTKSDEAQYDKLIESNERLMSSNRDMVDMVRDTLQHLQKVELRREDDYLATKTLYDQNRATFLREIAGLTTHFSGLFADIRMAIHSEMETAVSNSQSQYASRDVFKTFGLLFLLLC